MITAVLFDFDGLLVDSESVFFTIYRNLLADHGHDFTTADYLSAHAGTPIPEIVSAFQRIYHLPLSHEEACKRIEAEELRVRTQGIALKPGAVELLDHLRLKGLAVAVASSSPRTRVWSMLEAHGIAEHFRTSAHGEEVTRSKPDPEIFLLAASRLGVPPENCLVLEDSEMGIEAGHAAGMTVVCVPDMKTPDRAHRALTAAVLPSLRDVISFLDEGGAGSSPSPDPGRSAARG
ncbi:HAD family phosphatase [Schaalia sp. 19OD2882]|uniref:HAD family hydrolase n=1 Tax=Schaalia sp. 19OD2882 TaxID=2794089 RepID=UPI001C1EB165|nr:HAD family phosphatase [Schaalia sp. 19OD2882]QWW20033.1 HAD family phosphatase [Schaalia sp. 19OD2882]